MKQKNDLNLLSQQYVDKSRERYNTNHDNSSDDAILNSDEPSKFSLNK